MMAYGPLTVVECVRPAGQPVTGADIAKTYAQLQSQGFRPLWPPVHCPEGGRDRFMVAGVGQAPPKLGSLVAEKSDAGGFNF